MASAYSVGIAIDGTSPANLIADQARSAENGGAETLWIATHLFLRDPVSLAAAALAATRTLRVALMAVSPYAIHPVHAAMTAATLDELWPGRVTLSLGAGAPEDFAAAGIKRGRPLETLRQSISLCRSLLAGETPDGSLGVFPAAGRRLARPSARVPIILAASGPKMLALAGRAADGVIVSGATSVPFVRHCLQIATQERNSTPFLRAGIVYVSVGDDMSRAADVLRRPLGFILRGEHHAMNLRMGGASVAQDALRHAYADQDWSSVDRLIDDDTVSAHAACGTPDQVRNRLNDYSRAGLTHIILGGLIEPDQIARTLDATVRV